MSARRFTRTTSQVTASGYVLQDSSTEIQLTADRLTSCKCNVFVCHHLLITQNRIPGFPRPGPLFFPRHDFRAMPFGRTGTYVTYVTSSTLRYIALGLLPVFFSVRASGWISVGDYELFFGTWYRPLAFRLASLPITVP